VAARRVRAHCQARAGPAWCWLTRAGLAVTGQPYTPARPAAARLAHLRAVLAVRLALEAGQAYQEGRAWWRCERRIRAAIGGRATAHVPDAEVSWPDLPGSAYAGECWAIEAELTPKPLARTVGIMAALAARTADYHSGSTPSRGPRYARVVYLAAPPARGVTGRAAASLPPPLRAQVTVRDLSLSVEKLYFVAAAAWWVAAWWPDAARAGEARKSAPVTELDASAAAPARARPGMRGVRRVRPERAVGLSEVFGRYMMYSLYVKRLGRSNAQRT